MTRAQLCHPSMPSCRKRSKKKPKPHRSRGKKSAQPLKGGTADSPPHPLLKGVFLTLVVVEWLEEAPAAISSPPLPRHPPPLGRAESLRDIKAPWENMKSGEDLSSEMCWLRWAGRLRICLRPARRMLRRAKLRQEKVISAGKTNPP